MFILNFLRKHLLYRHLYNNQTYTKFLRKKGVTIGENTVFFSPKDTIVDTQRPYALKIGNNVKITAKVTILCHDFSYSVLRPVYHSIQNSFSGSTIIGDNCFLGIGSIIMPGVKLGDNVIVGTGSVVTKSFPSNLVIAGNPAKIICSLDDFYKKRKERQQTEAFNLANIIRKEYKREPLIEEMGSFYPLFLERDVEKLKSQHIRTNVSGDNENEIIKDFMSSQPHFLDFDDFLQKSKR